MKVVVANNYEANLGASDKCKEESTDPKNTTWWTSRRIYIVVGSAVVIVGLALGLGLGFGLKKSSGSVTSLDIPYLKPPVYSASPSGLKSRRRVLRDAFQHIGRSLSTFTTSAATTLLKSSLFSSGPADFNYRLGLVDVRLQEFKTRALQSNRVCLSTSASLFSPTLPNSESFPMYFSCKEKMSDSLNVYFGQKDGKYYVAELTTGSPSIGVLASIDSAGTVVDVWQIMAYSTSNTASAFHIKANKTSGTIQTIGAASYAGTGVGCGIKMSATTSAMWFYGNPSDSGNPNPCPTDTISGDYLASVVSGDWQSFCVDPSALTDLTSSLCTSLSTNFPLADFSYAQLVSTSYGATAYTLISSPTLPSGLVDFNLIDDTTR